MKLSIVVSLVTLISSSSLAVDVNTPVSSHDGSLIDEIFQRWSIRFNKTYATAQERKMRISIWKENHAVIKQHNSKKPEPSYKLGHNNFSDLSADEFRQRFFLGEYSPGIPSSLEDKLNKPTYESKIERRVEQKNLPKEVDWVENGAVTGVKDQGTCGSCWAFSAIGSIEGAKYLKTGELVSLSEQNLIDCDKYHDHGCNGGLMDTAFMWDESHPGVCSEDDYPYAEKNHLLCKRNCKPVSGTKVHNFVDVESNDAAIREAVSQQPVSIAIQANQQVFQFYQSGVFDSTECGNGVDHGVLMVGYGTDADTGLDYYTIKNSWGDSWGEDGFIRMGRETEDPLGPCGLYQLVSYPNV